MLERFCFKIQFTSFCTQTWNLELTSAIQLPTVCSILRLQTQNKNIGCLQFFNVARERISELDDKSLATSKIEL